jgi:hypothetical protein
MKIRIKISLNKLTNVLAFTFEGLNLLDTFIIIKIFFNK